VTTFSRKLTTACSLELALGFNNVWFVSGYARVFIRLHVVIVPYQLRSATQRFKHKSLSRCIMRITVITILVCIIQRILYLLATAFSELYKAPKFYDRPRKIRMSAKQ